MNQTNCEYQYTRKNLARKEDKILKYFVVTMLMQYNKITCYINILRIVRFHTYHEIVIAILL